MTNGDTAIRRICGTAITERGAEDIGHKVRWALRLSETLTIWVHLDPRAARFTGAAIPLAINPADRIVLRRTDTQLALSALTTLACVTVDIEGAFRLRARGTLRRRLTSLGQLWLNVRCSSTPSGTDHLSGRARTISLVAFVGAVW